jgi:uncharacterized membrane protein
MNTPNLKTAFAFIAVTALLAFASATGDAQSLFEVESVDVTVYRDGVAHVTQTVTVDMLTPEITLPLFSSSVENIIVLDEAELTVDYKINGEELTIFTLGAEGVSVQYDTIALTSKEAEVWTLVTTNLYTSSVFLPQNSTVIYLNMMPTAIDTSGTRIKLSLYPGQWEISYVLPLGSIDETDDNGASNTTIPIDYLIAATIALVAVVFSMILIIRRRKGPNVEKTMKAYPYLKKEDKEVIEFLSEKGGKAFEAEIRERFPDMPRTSLWRLVKRLQRLEIVEVKKIGLENQVQLKK